MSWLIYFFARILVAILQALPLDFVARLGRLGGLIWWMLDLKHRGLVKRNLAAAFPEKNASELARIARETFQRIGENSLSAVKTASMTDAQLSQACTVLGVEKLPKAALPNSPSNLVGAVGHFGNFELYARLAKPVTGWQSATTYRAMNQPGLDSIVQNLRATSGCIFYERRRDGAALKEALAKGGLFVGLLSDQHPNKGGVLVPFMGRECAATTAPAVLALRYDAPLFPVICYRVALGHWTVEVGDEIALSQNGAARTVEAITLDINRAFEAAVRRDPANWFWVHNRWKKPRIKKGRVPTARSED
ncbi:MAG: lysophospholipid acyltransferase family protein [Limisphaerales bacterium]